MSDNTNMIKKIEQQEKKLQELEQYMNELIKEMQKIRKGKIVCDTWRKLEEVSLR